MKKLIALFLVFAMCFGMFAGCKQEQVDPSTAPTTQPTEGGEVVDLGNPEALASVMEYLTTIYKDAGGLTPKDFTRVGTIPFGTTMFEVVWTASVGEDLVKIVRGADGMVTIDVNELCDVETPYTLTATITDAAGNSLSHTWEHILPAYLSAEEILKQAYALAAGESLPYEATLTGVVTEINTPWSDQYGNITVTMVVEGFDDMPVECYRLAGDDAKNIAVGDTITVTGTLTNYKGKIEFAQGCTLDNRISGGGTPPGEKEYTYSWHLKDGDKVVIYNRSYKKALSSKKTSFYNVGVSVSTDANGKLTGFGPNEVWTVKHNGSSYSFINSNGDKMALDKEYSNLNADSSYDDWKLVRVGSGKYLIQNTKRSDFFLEWYAKYSNFSTYNAYTPEEDKQFIFSFYVIPEDEVVEDTTVYFDATPVENPEAGKAYKLVLFQNGIGKELGFTGKMAGYYYETSDDLNAVVDVYLEAAEGGYRLYFKNGSTKTYLNVVPRGGEGNEGKVNVVLETTAKSVYTLNTEFNYLSTEVEGNTFYLGTYGTNTTISASNVSYIEDTSKIGVSQFVAWLADTVKTDAPVEDDDTTGGEGEEEEPVYEDVVTMVNAPEAGKAYKLLMDKKDGKLLYFNGKTESESVTFRLATTTNAAKAADVYLEEVAGGYLLYFMNGETKTYIKVYERTAGDPGYGKGSLEFVTTAPAEYYTYDTTAKTLIYTKDENNAYYMGTYSTFTTVSVSNTSYITGDKAGTVDVSQFPVRFATVELAEREEVTLESIAISGKTEYVVGAALNLTVTATYSDGETENVTAELTGYDMSVAGTYTVTATYEGKTATITITVAEPQVDDNMPYEIGKAYKLMMDKAGVKLYFNGLTESESITYRLATTMNASEAVDVYLEEAAGGYLMYFMNNGVKTYIHVFQRTNGDPGFGKGSLELITSTPTDVLTYYAEADTFIHDYDGNNAYFMGTYSTYTTISVSNTSYITGNNAAKVDVEQFPARLVEVTGEEPAVTLESIAISGKTEYTVGDALNLTVTAIYSNGFEETVTAELAGYDMNTAGEQTVTATFEGKTATITIIVKEAEVTEPEAALKDGDKVVIWVPAYNKALSSQPASAGSFYQMGVDVAETNGVLTGYADTEIWTVIVNDDGTYSFAMGGQNLGMAGSYSSMSLGAVNDDWQLIDLGDGLYNVKNVVRGNYIEWYASKNNWSTYASNDAATNDLFQLAFYVVPGDSGETPAVPVVESIAISGETEYTVGDALELTVTATYSDGAAKEVAAELTGYDMSVAGTYTVTATYEGKTATITITVAAQEVEQTPGYQQITSADELTTGKYVLVANNGYAPTALDDPSKTSPWLLSGKPAVNSDGTIAVADAEGYVWELTVSGSSVQFADANGNAIAPKSGNTNGIIKGSYNWAWTFANGTFKFTGTGSDTTTLACNSDATNGLNKFRAYKNSTVTGTYASNYHYNFTLYKLVEDSENGGETPAEPVVESIAISGKTEYTVGDALELTVTATYSDGTAKEVAAELTGYDMNTAGSYTVTATFEGKTETITIIVKAAEVTEPEAALKDGDKVVIWAPAYNKALSSQPASAGSFYQMGVDVTEASGVLTGYGETEIWTVSVNSDGTYNFAYNGQNLGMQASYSSMSLGAVNDDWQLIDLGDGLYNVKNVVRGNYIEWYASKNNWSTYTSNDAATNDLFQLAFYVVPNGGETPAEPVVESIAISGETEYTVGDALELTVTATYSDGTTKEVAAELTGYDMNTAGSYTVTATFEGKTATVTIIIKEAASSDPEVKSVTLTFVEGNRTVTSSEQLVFVENGITFTLDKAEAANLVGHTDHVRCYAKSEATLAYPGMTKIVFTCTNETQAGYLAAVLTDPVVDGVDVTVTLAAEQDTFKFTAGTQCRIKSVAVYSAEINEGGEEPEVTLTGIEVTAPTKVEYTVGEELDTTGLVVTAKYSDESTKDVTTEATLSGYDLSAAGEQTVTVTFEGQTATFAITVKAAESGEEGGETEEPTTVTVSIADYAAANGWVNSTKYTSLKMDDVVTVSVSGGGNTGKYYTSGTNWRMYQTESPKITVAAEGKTIVSVKITYTIEKTGVLTLDGANVTSGTVVEVNAASVVFSVGNTGSATNGQVRITSIEVTYQ